MFVERPLYNHHKHLLEEPHAVASLILEVNRAFIPDAPLAAPGLFLIRYTASEREKIRTAARTPFPDCEDEEVWNQMIVSDCGLWCSCSCGRRYKMSCERKKNIPEVKVMHSKILLVQRYRREDQSLQIVYK